MKKKTHVANKNRRSAKKYWIMNQFDPNEMVGPFKSQAEADRICNEMNTYFVVTDSEEVNDDE